jgi:hypothetical protein
MGYRSDITAVFYTTHGHSPLKTPEENEKDGLRNIAMLDMYMRESFPESIAGWTDGDGLRRLAHGGRVIWEFIASNVKWYETYDEVKAFEAFWNNFVGIAEEAANGDDPVMWACEFIRIGENMEDIEERSSTDSDWLLQVNRTIERNY